MTKGRIFSGMQPSGTFHLGNYLGALENWVKLQHEYECIFCIVDWHALTSNYEDPAKIPENIQNMAMDWLSAGLDPDKNIIFVLVSKDLKPFAKPAGICKMTGFLAERINLLT